MVNDRLQQLLDYHSKEPNDTFIVYGLALEYLKTDKKQALFYFEKLLSEHKNYLPTYYHAGQLLHDIQELSRAKEIYEAGIALARKTGDDHALRELLNAYQNFLFEEDME